MAKRNFKVHSDIGLDLNRMKRTLSVLDTGAGPNFIRKSELPSRFERQVRTGPLPDICDANGKPLSMLGAATLPVRLGNRLVKVEFIVCNKLAAPAILGCDFCDRFVEAILPRRKLVELDDGTTVPITRRVLKRPQTAPELPRTRNTIVLGGRVSPKVKVAVATEIPAEAQAWVTVTTERHGLVVLQPFGRLYDNHKLLLSNAVVQVEPNTAFKVLVANFGKTPKRVAKNQVVGTVLPHPTAVMPSHIKLAEVLGLIDAAEVEPDANPLAEANKTSSPVPKSELDVKDVDALDLSHVPEQHRRRLREMLRKYSPMWDGSLGEISTMEHHIELTSDAKPIAQHAFRAGPRQRDVVQKIVDEKLKAGVMEPAQSAWASPVVLVPKPDGSLRFCVD